MDLKSLIASLPVLRRLWRFLPGPLRVPLLVVAAAVWLWRKVRGRDPEPSEHQDAPARTEDPDAGAA